MKWTRMTKPSEVKLEGVTLDIDQTNNSITAITAKDASGNQVKFSLDSYNLYILVPAAPKMVKKWALRGEYKGLQVDELFEYEHEANSRRYELGDELTVSEVEVPEEE